MALPKMKHPTFEMKIPSTGKAIRYRPFTVAEEKLLMLAKESEDAKDTINAIKQLIINCVIDKIDVDKLTYFDLEFFFLMLRAKSVSNIVELEVKDDDGNTYPIEADLDQLLVSQSKCNPLIDLGSGFKVLMKYPSYEVISTLHNMTADDTLSLVRECIEQIYDGDTVYETAEYTTSELDEFVLSLGAKQMEMIQKFFEDMPRVYLDAKYRTKSGETKEIKIEGLQSFFG